MRAIDADALDIMEYREEFPSGTEDNGWNAAVRLINDYIQCAPTLDYKDLVPQGEWIRDNSTMVHCSVCKVVRNAFWETYGNLWSFCPSCGARMKGADT